MRRGFPRPVRDDRTAGQPKIFLVAAILAVLGACSAQAVEPAQGFLRFSVQDRDGAFIPIGEVEFCRDGDERSCVYADIERGFPGHFLLKAKDLEPDVDYTVMIYTMDVQVIYEMRGWRFEPEKYDRGYDKVLDCEKFLVYPQFHGDPQRGMEFSIDTTLNPVWEERAGAGFVIEEPDPLRFPDFIFTASAVGLAGANFGADEDAAGGVLDASPGWRASAVWRHGYPRRHKWEDGWVACRELTLSYAQNRYVTAEIMTPGRESDVTFHRVDLSYGVTRMSQSQINHYGLAALVSWGGIYDGSQLLSWLERDYRLVGVGLRAHFRRMVMSGGGLDVGGVLEASAVYYPADAAENDHWHGLAPSISLGLVVF